MQRPTVIIVGLFVTVTSSLWAPSASADGADLRASAQARRLARIEAREEAAAMLTQAAARRRAARLAAAGRPVAVSEPNPVISARPTTTRRTVDRVNARTARRRVTTTKPLDSSSVDELATLINDARSERGLPALRTNVALRRAAAEHAREIARRGSFLDEDFDSEALDERLKAIGYAAIDEKTCDCASWSYRIAEVFGKGSADPAKVAANWLADESADEQILSPLFSEIGIAVTEDSWVAVLGHVDIRARTVFTSSQRARFAEDVLRLTNAERAKEGLPAYVRNELLDASAFAHARDMFDRGFFDHASPEGVQPKDRIEATGYLDGLRGYGVGENIAKGQDTPEEVVEAWMNSPGHRANIMHADFEEIGIGLYGDVWAQNFGKRFR